MAKQKNMFENYVTHREILNFAILYMSKKCEEQIEKCGGDMKVAKEYFGFYFTKLRLLCEAYEIETGSKYELRGGCSIDLSDLY